MRHYFYTLHYTFYYFIGLLHSQWWVNIYTNLTSLKSLVLKWCLLYSKAVVCISKQEYSISTGYTHHYFFLLILHISVLMTMPTNIKSNTQVCNSCACLIYHILYKKCGKCTGHYYYYPTTCNIVILYQINNLRGNLPFLCP